jgi:hypothetical protein
MSVQEALVTVYGMNELAGELRVSAASGRRD